MKLVDWIPSDEMLPAKGGEYLATIKESHKEEKKVRVISYTEDMRELAHNDFYPPRYKCFYIYDSLHNAHEINVIAWTMLPRIYIDKRGK